MSNKTYDTVIVGAGISGLACANQLNEYSEDFIVISKDIGGRILTSENGDVNYGAFFVCSDYYNVLKYITLKSRIKLRDFCFHENDDTYVLFEPKLILNLYQILKIKKILFTFRKKLRQFRKISTYLSQKQAIENDEFLHELYMQDATDFVTNQNLQQGTNIYLSKALYSTTFSTINEMNAFSFLQFLLPLITPIYKFKFEKEKMISQYRDRIYIDNVQNIQYKNDLYKIKSNNKITFSKKIVLATQINWSKQFAGIKKTNKPTNTNMIHLKGKPKENIIKKKFQLFSPKSNTQAIANLEDDTYLFYYKKEPPLLKNFFTKPQIIAKKRWNEAGTINGHNLIESNRGKNMYLIGDFNIAGLEESYITGVYSADQIIDDV